MSRNENEKQPERRKRRTIHMADNENFVLRRVKKGRWLFERERRKKNNGQREKVA